MAPRDLRTRLTRRAAKAGLSLPDALADRFLTYFELLQRWNQKINLTALDDIDLAIDRLLLEPLAASRFLPAGPFGLMDVGSGGGSPAIPLRLAAPSGPLVMVEAKSRKSAFLREAIRHLQLEDATVETSRYEELLSRAELHEAMDVLSVRAVRLETRAMMTLQAFLKVDGLMLLFRGPGGPSAPGIIIPPLRFVQTTTLIDALQSRLTVVSKVL